MPTLIETILIGLGSFVFILYVYFTLGNKNVRTFVIASIPSLRRGRVMNINFLKNRQIVFDLVKAEENKLIKYGKEKGKDYVRNREITPGSSFIDPGSNSPIYFTMTGNSKTFDPTVEESQTALDDITQLKGFDLGQEVSDYMQGLAGKKEIAGLSVNTLFFVVVLAMVFFGAMIFMMNSTLLEIGEVVAPS